MSDTITAPVEVRPAAPIESSDDFEQMMNPFKEPSDVDPNHKAHYVSLRDNPKFEQRFGIMDAKGMINTARLFRVELTAMCGHTWVPELNPVKYDVCGACADIAYNRLTNN
jgi:hypothetical protein